MGIYTAEELGNMTVPQSLPEAAAKGAINFLCRAAPIVAGYGLASGNLPATAFGAGGSLACGLPLFPVKDPPPPPANIPVSGGQCPIIYRVEAKGEFRRGDGQTFSEFSGLKTVQGPVGNLFVKTISDGQGGGVQDIVSRNGPLNTETQFMRAGFGPPPNDIKWIWFQYTSIFSRDGLPDNCGDGPPSFPGQDPLPPPYQLPPGWPDAPRLPGGPDTVPYKPPGSRPDQPPYRIPIRIPDIPLPVIIPIAPSIPVNISAPITIPVSIPVSISGTANVTIPVQIGPSGEIRTPPDLLCECEYEPNPVGAPATETTEFVVPYYECGDNPGSRVATLEVVRDRLPAGLSEKLLSSVALARVGCEQKEPTQVDAIRLSSGEVDGVVGRVILVPSIPKEVACVRVLIFPTRPQDFRQTKLFEGTGQRLFGILSWCLDGAAGGHDQVELWDMRTDALIPLLPQKRTIKLLLKPGLRWELWDTGLRL